MQSLMELGTAILYLIFLHFKYRFNEPTMMPRSPLAPLDFTNSATSIGFDFLISLSGIQDLDPSLKRSKNFQPFASFSR